MTKKKTIINFKIQHALFDLGVLLFVLATLFFIFLQKSISGQVYFPYALVILIIWLFTFYCFGGYDYNKIFKISHNFKLISTSLFVAMLCSSIVGYYYFEQFNLLTINGFTLVFVSVFYIIRLAFTKMVSTRLPKRHILIYGAGWAGKEIQRELIENEYLKFNVIGFIEDSENRDFSDLTKPILGNGKDIKQIIQDYSVDLVIFAITKKRGNDVFYAKSYLQEQDIDTIEMPHLYERISGRVPVMHVNNVWHDFYVSLKHKEPYWLYRLYNIALACFFTIVFLPVLPFVALAVKLTSKGPVLYSQKRVGKKEKLFTLYKFRSMRIDAEKFGAQWATENDPRLTPIGKFLRKSRLDELPQLINVFRGEMNFVGPRPERPEFVKDLNTEIPFYRSRHQVAPGLTGWAQVMMGYVNSVDGTLKKLQYDLYYIKNRNVFLDLLILIKTVHVVITRRGT
ncbi:MAG: sugar transferase [Candidatus Cloacimonetes bacterium]|nr:sugar transferase [Candidatus Cloacimonadota bacterium]